MKSSTFWKWLYGVFRNGNGNGNGHHRFLGRKGEDAFEALHREFLWLKTGQIREKMTEGGHDSVWNKNALSFFEPSFIDALSQESIGGNAGAGHTGVNAFYNPITGEIKSFGNFQEIKEAVWDEITGQTTIHGDFHCLFRINVQHTGEIAEVIFEQRPLNPLACERLIHLVGVQVMIPFTRIYQALKSTELAERKD